MTTLNKSIAFKWVGRILLALIFFSLASIFVQVMTRPSTGATGVAIPIQRSLDEVKTLEKKLFYAGRGELVVLASRSNNNMPEVLEITEGFSEKTRMGKLAPVAENKNLRAEVPTSADQLLDRFRAGDGVSIVPYENLAQFYEKVAFSAALYAK